MEGKKALFEGPRRDGADWDPEADSKREFSS